MQERVIIKENKIDQAFFTDLVDAANIQQTIDNIHARLLVLRKQNYDTEHEDAHGKVTLIADCDKPGFSIIHPYEHEILALRGLKGMVVIAKHLSVDETERKKFLDDINETFNRYLKDHDIADDQSNLRKRLNGDFIKILMRTLKIKKSTAYTQLAMATDIGRLLEDHPVICTRHTEGDVLVEETSRMRKVHEDYHERHFTAATDQTWFKSAERKAGLKNKKKNWLHNCFSDMDGTVKTIKEKGVPASPSSRWLPLPANLKDEVATRKLKKFMPSIKGKEEAPDDASGISYEHSFVRMGTAVAFEIDDKETRFELAKEQLKEIFHDDAIREHQRKCDALYGAFFPNRSMQLCYLSLLSPIVGEEKGPHKDNNGAFIMHTENALKEINRDRTNPIHHTNAAINKLSILTREQKKHNDIRRNKIALTIELFLGKRYPAYVKDDGRSFQHGIDIERCINEVITNAGEPPYPLHLQQEIRIRLRAAYYLQLLLENRTLKSHQRQLMIAALEFLTLGAQAYTAVGCKSARDRTAIFADAVNATVKSFEAMQDWNKLKIGLKKGLKRGHHYRTMSDHLAAIKDNVVHTEINNLIHYEIRNKTKKLYDAFKESGGATKYNEEIKLKEPFTGLTFHNIKERGANDPGEYGAEYKDEYGNISLVKQDAVQKVIGEALAGKCLETLYAATHVQPSEYAQTRLVVVGKAPGEQPDAPDKTGENTYLQSMFIPGYEDDLWKNAYRQYYMEGILKELTPGANVEKIKQRYFDMLQRLVTNVDKISQEELAKRIDAIDKAVSKIEAAHEALKSGAESGREALAYALADTRVEEHRGKPHAVLASLTKKRIHAKRINIPSKYIIENDLIRDFADAIVPRLLISDFGVHSGNIGVANRNGRKRIVSLDFGAAFCGLRETVNLYGRMSTGTSFYKNHLLEYDDDIIKSSDMAKKMIAVGTLDASFIHKMVDDQVSELKNYFGIKPIKKFCERLDMPSASYKKYTQDEDVDELLGKIKNYMITRLQKRQASLKTQGLILLLERCYDAKNKTVRKEQLRNYMYLYGSHIQAFVFSGAFAKTPLILNEVKDLPDFRVHICDALIEINNNKENTTSDVEVALALLQSVSKDVKDQMAKIDRSLGHQPYKVGLFNERDLSKTPIHTPTQERAKRATR